MARTVPVNSEELEQQQAVLLDMLRRAGGAPVGYAELQDAGIEFPASVVAELELAGVELERCHVVPGGPRPLMGVRLDPARDPARLSVGDQSGRSRSRERRAASVKRIAATRLGLSGAAIRRWALPIAAVAGIAAVIVLALIAVTDQGGGAKHAVAQTARRGRAHRAVARPRTSESASRTPTRPGTTSASGAKPKQRHRAPPPVSAALATELDVRGHDLLEAGRYGAAVPVLRRTLLATGERLDDCLQPVSETCLVYAYALYDLGRALQLSGHPAEAVSFLEHRLQIDNQRPVVQAELAQARTSIG